MTRKIFKAVSRLCLITICVIPFVQGAQAVAHDVRHHNKHHHNDGRDYGYRDQEQNCRQIVQEFQVSNFFTYTESGLACRDGGGVWQIVSDTKYPEFYGHVYFLERGQRVYFGEVSPRPRPHESERPHCEHEGHERYENGEEGRYSDAYWQDERDYGYLDRNNYKNR